MNMKFHLLFSFRVLSVKYSNTEKNTNYIMYILTVNTKHSDVNGFQLNNKNTMNSCENLVVSPLQLMVFRK